MFAKIIENIFIRWECTLEWYLLRVDHANTNLQNFSKKFESKFDQVSERTDHSRRMLQWTLIGIIIAFTVILFSCQTAPRPYMPPQPRKFDAARPERELDQLYIKRNEMTIKNTETGSTTGSIWADSKEPKSFLVDASPNREGQTITVVIPDELQFDPKSSGSAADSDKNGKDKKSTNKETASTGNSSSGLKLTDPDDASPASKLAMRPIKSFKMQIVAFDPTGDVFLRGTRKYSGTNGDENSTMVLAKVPRRALTGFELDARELTDVAVSEDLGGRTREYAAPGWDEMVSRRLAGFTPDLNSELAALDSLRDEIKTAQASLKDQAKANEMERERIRNERSRMTGQNPLTGQGQGSNTSAQNQAATSAPKAAEKGEDKKEGAKE
ncbi:MAG: hypothetical protein ACO3A4_14150 [Silvanigrellaceae bacterium]